MNLKMLRNRFAILIILTSALAAALSGCRGAKPVLESVIVKDTVIVTKIKYLTDTLELYKDTVIYQDKVRLQLQYMDRKVYVEATCLPDTIRVTQTKILTRNEPRRKRWNFDQLVFGALLVLLILYLFKRWVDKATE
jgi:hypothetical protein